MSYIDWEEIRALGTEIDGKAEAEKALKEAFNTDKLEIDIDWLIYDVLILKAECLANEKLLEYCNSLEERLFQLKYGEARLSV